MAFKVISVVSFFLAITFPTPTVLCIKYKGNELTIFDNIRPPTSFPGGVRDISFPGTKWCGPGDNAEHDDDLGYLAEVDMCCRAHDKCHDYMISEETKHNLTNPDRFTRLNCKCEEEFQICLSNVDSYTSSLIGYTYTTTRSDCFELAHPILDCLEYEGYFQQRCIRYKVDLDKPEEWQWFDIPFY